MPSSTPPAPLRRLTRPLTLLTGVYLVVLAGTVVAVSVWFAGLPEPEPLRPVTAGNAPASLPEPPLARKEPVQAALQEDQPPQAAPEAEPPIIERRWSQSDAAPATPDPGRLRGPPTTNESGLDRSSETRRRRVRQFGGTPRTEDAVEAGLAWLAAHQDADGTWDRFKFGRHCPRDDRCPGAATHAKGYSFRSGLTGLALLAFLGAGYTDREGPYQDVVARAVDALLRAQLHHGGFAGDERMAGYNDALATFALAEYHAMTHEPQAIAPLQRAVQQLVLSQQELGGWDYLRRNDSGRNDTSLTAWVVQALHACVAAGIHVPQRVLVKAALHFARAGEPDGRVRYSDAGIGFDIDEQTLQPIYRYGPAMTAAGLTCEQLLGWRFDSAPVRRQQALLSQQYPSTTLLQGGDPTQLHSYYYWYYGTIAAFQAGGRCWERWNAVLRDAVLTLQNRKKDAAGHKAHAFGSWPPFGQHWGKWGRQGSRVYTTALCVLTLEIYYRHTPAYLEDVCVLDAGDWLAFLEEACPRDRRQAVQALREMRVEVAEPVLVNLLQDGDQSLARAAAVTLTTFDSPLGRPLLEHLDDTVPVWERGILEKALRRAQEIEALPPTRGTVRGYDAQQRLATLELPRAYIGMLLDVRRDGQIVAQLRVIRRFTGRRTVVATLVADHQGAPPKPGDAATSR